MNIIMWISAFGGGMLGAALGGIPAFVFTGLTVIAAVFSGDAGAPVINMLCFGPIFGPHVAFGGAVAATAFAKRKGLVENGQNLAMPLFGVGDYRVLLVGGVFGLINYLIQFIYSKLLGNVVFGLEGWTDTVALTVFTSGIIVRCIMTKSGLTGKYTGTEKRQFFPRGKRLQFLAITGLGVGIAVSGFAVYLGQLAQKGSEAALYIFNNIGNIGFALAAVSLIFVCMGQYMDSWHHTAVTSATTAMIIFAGTMNPVAAMISAIVVAVIVSIANECALLTFNSYADSHIDPPATVIMIMQLINFCLIQPMFPSIMG